MPEKLTDLLVCLAEDPQELAKFQASPDEFVRQRGLSSAEEAVLTSRKPELIRKALLADIGQSTEDAAGIVVIVLEWVRSTVMDAPTLRRQNVLSRLKGIKY